MQNSIKEILQVFGMKQLREALTVIGVMKKYGLTVEEVKAYNQQRLNAQLRVDREYAVARKIQYDAMPECPECEKTHLQISKMPENKGKYKSIWWCPDEGCPYYEHSRKTVNEAVTKCFKESGLTM
jgi:nitrogen regulatory protein PII